MLQECFKNSESLYIPAFCSPQKQLSRRGWQLKGAVEDSPKELCIRDSLPTTQVFFQAVFWQAVHHCSTIFQSFHKWGLQGTNCTNPVQISLLLECAFRVSLWFSHESLNRTMFSGFMPISSHHVVNSSLLHNIKISSYSLCYNDFWLAGDTLAIRKKKMHKQLQIENHHHQHNRKRWKISKLRLQEGREGGRLSTLWWCIFCLSSTLLARRTAGNIGTQVLGPRSR